MYVFHLYLGRQVIISNYQPPKKCMVHVNSNIRLIWIKMVSLCWICLDTRRRHFRCISESFLYSHITLNTSLAPHPLQKNIKNSQANE